ncbi:MAG: DUF11 domain-containing protein [bacterium]|nr:DUF11 domain-containing protein [bacterium]
MRTRHWVRVLWGISVIIAIVALSPALRAQSGPFDNWLALDGSNDAAACADSVDLSVTEPSSLTVEAWFQADDTEPYPMERRPLVVKRGAWSLSVEMDASYMGGYDCIAFDLYTDDNSRTGSAYCLGSLDTGWHHVALVLDNPGNLLNLYLDGERENSIAQPALLRDSTYGVEIGHAVYSSSTWDGRIDEVRISDEVRYSGTTYTVPGAAFACDASTVALWHFDECAGATTLYDGRDGSGSQCGTVEDTLIGTGGAQTDGPPCSYSIDPASAPHSAAGGSGSVGVTAPPCCPWTAVSNDAWITVTSGANGSGNGNGSVGYSVAANTGPARSGTITIAGHTFTVEQASGCTYSIDPTSADYPVAGGSGSVNVTAAAVCPWTAVSNDAWITVTSGASGSGNGSVGYSVAANSGPARNGTVTIAEQTFTVNQASGCTYVLSPTSAMLPSTGGSGSVDVTTQAGCTWTATVEASAQGWLSITSGASGTGSGTVICQASASGSGCNREAGLEIADGEAVIRQEGAVATASWSTTGDLTTGRSSHVAVRLLDGRVLAAGGDTTSAELFDPGTGTWSATTAMNVAREDFDAVLLPDGRVLAAGGWTDTAEIFDPATETWTLLPNMNCPRPETKAVVLYDGRVLVAGGRSPCAAYSSEIFDPITGQWTIVYMHEGYFGHTATRLKDGRVLIAGNQYAEPASAEIFDPATDSWTTTASMNYKRWDYAAALLPNGRVLVAGGQINGSTSEEYDPETGTWTIVGNLNAFRSMFTATALLDGRVLAVGWAATTEVYSPASQTWSAVTSPQRDHGTHATATLLRDGRVLVAGGGADLAVCDLLDATASRSISPGFEEYPAAGGSGSIAVAASAGCEWRATSTRDWITTTGATQGSGPGSVAYSAAASGVARVGAVLVEPDLFFVIQKHYTLAVTLAGTGSGEVTSDPAGIDCGATCVAEYEHGTVVTLTASPAGGSGFVGWSGGCAGSAACVVTMDTVQSVTAEFAPCGVALSPPSRTIGAGGGTESFSVASPTGCPWTAVSNDGWITITSSPGGTGDGSVDYAVAANPGPARTGTISVEGETFTVNQEDGCTYAIDPTSADYDQTGGTGAVAVSTVPGCTWEAISNDPWITVTSGDAGTGDGSVGYSVDANTGPQRTGTLTIAGREHSVEQSGIPFVDISAGLFGVTQGEVAWGDYDNDGDLDLAMTGSGSAKLYRNNERSSFTRLWPGFTAMWSSSLAWGDYDNDGDLDLVACGIVPGGSVATKLYRNDSGAFADAGAGLAGTCYCSVAWGDYDDDGDLDLLTAGTGGPKLYRNDGGASFTDLGLELEAVYHSAVAWGDYDDDGDLDFLLTGQGGDSDPTTALYRNDSRGRFTKVPAALPGLSYGSVAWGDYDGDGDLDLVMSGRMGWSPSTRILRNDGGALFVDIAAGLPGVEQGAVAWGDYDNDGDLDVLLSGGGISEVYRNDGGGFTPAGSGLPGLSFSEAAWGDYDNDGDLDVLLAGRDDAIVAMVLRNDLATANAPPGAPAGLAASTVAGAVPLSWTPATDAETPSDALTYNLRVSTTPGGVDILSPMASTSSGLRRLPKMGNANHGTTAVVKALPPGSYYWSVQAVDTAFAGSPFAAESTLTVCAASIDPSGINPGPAGGSGTVTVTTAAGCAWTAVPSEPWISVTAGANGVGDGSVSYSIAANESPERSGILEVAGHEFTIVQASGCTYSISPSAATVGANGGSGSFTVTSGAGCPWTAQSNDPGWLTVTSGSSGSGNGTVGYSAPANPGPQRTGTITIAGQTRSVTQLAEFFADSGISLVGVYYSSVAWGDYDNDGDLDAILAGLRSADSSTATTAIYRNDGGGVFVDVGADLPGLYEGCVAWGDYDNDGDLDLLVVGRTPGSIARVYRNDAGVFVDVGAGLPGVLDSSAAWGDYDNDGDLDILLAGWGSSGSIAKVFRNDPGGFTDVNASLAGINWGSALWGDYDNDGDLDILLAGNSLATIYRNDAGVFSDSGIALPGVRWAAAAWGDYDHDGDLDLLLTGEGDSGPLARVYRNNGGAGMVDIAAPLEGVRWGSVAWGDYDNDGDLDILLAGSVGWSIAKVYRNDGGGGFTDTGSDLQAVYLGAAAWGDYDNDGHLDVLFTGKAGSGGFTKIYRNTGAVANLAPDAPTGLVAGMSADLTPLSWAPATDAQTPSPGLTYNLRVATTPGGVDVLSPMSAVGTGWRRVAQIGNAGPGTTAVIQALPPGDYYWSVQAVDSALAGSPFASEGTFTVCSASLDPASTVVSRDGGSHSVSVTVAAGCTWTATSNDAWITVTSGSSGTGDGSVGFSVVANTGPARSGTITIAGQTLTVDQEAACSYSLSIDPISTGVAVGGGSGSVNVTAGAGCAWTAVSNAAWITVTSGTGGTGDGVVGYTVAANLSLSPRSGTVTIAEQTFTVNQAEFVCDVSLSPPALPAGTHGIPYSQIITAGGGVPAFYFAVTAGTLPPGLGLAGGGLLSGTPTLPGTYPFTVTASDSIGCQGSRGYSLVVGAVADLSLTKGDSPDPVDAGATVTYLLSVANAGPSTATGLALTDTLPAGVAFVSASGTGWTCGEASGTVTCTRPSLAVGAAPALTIQVDAPAAAGTLINSASITAVENDPNPDNNTATAETAVTAQADLALTKIADPDPVVAGAMLSYTLSVANAGSSSASGLTLTDTLPAGVSWVSASGTGWSCAHADGIVTCTRPSLAVGPAPAVTIEVTAPLVGDEIVNEATVSAVESDPQSANNTATASTTVDVYPAVTGVDSVRGTADGVLDEGEATELAVTQLLIEFSESMTVTNPSNYALIEAGANASFDTSPCGTIAGDDQAVVISQVADFPGAQGVALSFATAFSLPAGRYRLSACPTLTDLNGNPLDGDGNGQGGDAFSRSFRIGRTNSLANPNFDTDLSGWTAASPVPGEIQWGVADADDAPSSGSAEVMTSWGASQTFQLAQCVVAPGKELYRASAKGRIASGEGGAPTLVVKVESYAGAICEGSPLAIATSSAIAGDTTDAWIEIAVPAMAALGSGSLRVVIEVLGGSADSFTVDLDHAMLRVGSLFEDGFESGNTAAWSETVP